MDFYHGFYHGVLKNDFIDGFLSYVLVYTSNWFIFIVASLHEEKKEILTRSTQQTKKHVCHAMLLHVNLDWPRLEIGYFSYFLIF